MGLVDLSTEFSTTYDSNVFALGNSSFKSNQVTNPKLESKDDIILKLSPVLHFSKEFSLIKANASAGVEISNFLFNDSRSYVIPVTNFNLDFDESLKKRLSTNSKIRFTVDLGLGQSVGTDLTEGDLVSYSFFNTNLSSRYNHSPKFGVGASINYEMRKYQSGAIKDDYDDLTILPISSDLFYIYSPKLDFFLNHVYSKTDSSNSSTSMANTTSHSLSFGANGILTPKLSGKISLGYSILSFRSGNLSNQNSIISASSLNFKHNQKTSSEIQVERDFSPTATSSSQISTFLRYNLNHSFNHSTTGTFGLSHMYSEVFINNIDSFEMKQLGFDLSLRRILSKNFTSMFRYDFSLIKRNNIQFHRNVISASIIGRF